LGGERSRARTTRWILPAARCCACIAALNAASTSSMEVVVDAAEVFALAVLTKLASIPPSDRSPWPAPGVVTEVVLVLALALVARTGVPAPKLVSAAAVRWL
jgi:hypothetical protein